MISIDTYITILFSIITAALLGATISVIIQNISLTQKIKIMIIILCITVILIIIVTLIFYYGKHKFKISSLWNFKNIIISKLFPFNNKIFQDPSFSFMYNLYIWISIMLFVIIFGIKLKKNKLLLKRGFILLLILGYVHVWVIYLTCNILFKYVSLWLCYILQTIIYITIFYIEIILFCFIASSEPHKYMSKKQSQELLSVKKERLKHRAKDIINQGKGRNQ